MANDHILSDYLEEFQNALDCQDGAKAARLLSFQDEHIKNRNLYYIDPSEECAEYVQPDWKEVVVSHLRCCRAAADGDLEEANACQTQVAQSFYRILTDQKDENWSLPVMYTVTRNLREFGGRLRSELTRKGDAKAGKVVLEKCAETVMGFFRVCVGDSRADARYSKKVGVLHLINTLMKIYMKVNTLQLCKPLIRTIDSLPASFAAEKFSVAQLVTYRFFVGRKAMFDSDYKMADEYLSFAFLRCHRLARRNKRSILIYLIPVKMLLGYTPKEEVLRKYDLPQFVEVVSAVKRGDVKRLNDALESDADFFVKTGIYLILEKLKMVAYRCLFRKISVMINSHQLPLGAFSAALKLQGETDIDDDEVECIVANLIYENKIKGYISHAHQKLVVSKQNAFPPLCTVPLQQ